MQKSFLILAIAASLILPSPVSAEESIPPAASGIRQVRQEIREERRETLEEIKTERRETRTEQKTKIQEMRGAFNITRSIARATMLEKKYQFIYNRFQNIITRFEARIKLLKDAGKGSELAATETKLLDAKNNLSSAKEKSDSVISALRAVTADSTKDDFAKIQAEIKVVGNAYKSVNDALKLALKELKTVSKPALPAASAAVAN